MNNPNETPTTEAPTTEAPTTEDYMTTPRGFSFRTATTAEPRKSLQGSAPARKKTQKKTQKKTK